MSTNIKKIGMIAAISVSTFAGGALLEPAVVVAVPATLISEAPSKPLVLNDFRAQLMQRHADSPLVERAPVKTAPTWANKTWAFVQCIVGVGVPIGLAWAIVSNPPLVAWLAGRGPLPGTTGGFAVNYLTWLKGACGYVFSY